MTLKHLDLNIGRFSSNIFLVFDDKTRDAVMFDVGGDPSMKRIFVFF
jgi:hypothetical protein